MGAVAVAPAQAGAAGLRGNPSDQNPAAPAFAGATNMDTL